MVTRPRRARYALVAFTLLVSLLVPGAVHAKAHLWRISEIFSNADGTVQFIEMHECCGSTEEHFLASTFITSDANSYMFANHLEFTESTAFRWVLLGTADFAALPGAPTPDYIIPDNFFDPTSDTLTYVGGNDVANFALLPPGSLPTDGLNSLHRDVNTGVMTAGVNSPINFDGVSGSVSPPMAVPGPAPWLVAPILAAAAGWVGLRRLRRGRA